MNEDLLINFNDEIGVYNSLYLAACVAGFASVGVVIWFLTVSNVTRHISQIKGEKQNEIH